VPSSQELLDPESWANVLEVYASTVNMGVALVGPDGRLIGRCHNPKPIWSLARAARPDWGASCLFCLNAADSCTAAADAQRTFALTTATDSAGFVHVAVPLSLGGQHLGTLLAGQVFDGYPEMLPLERVARGFGLSQQELWDLARRDIPISRASLLTYGSLLDTLGRAFVRERNSIILRRDLAHANQRLLSANRQLKEANVALSEKVGELDQSNGEKDILLNEVHHRVNNNLQVIASLLRMQAEAFPDDQVASALRASQSRVESMAMIHSQLYHSADWRAVDFADYATTLSGNLFRSYGIDEARIALRVEIDHFRLSVDKAIPAGLILNELISNALKHAFPDNRAGTIAVRGRLADGRIELSVEDNGAGTRNTGEPRKRQALGLNIVNILCRQLKGTFVRPQDSDRPGPGSLFSLSFPYETALATATE
jgi:two-component sensor histidine kinase/ligand-binding sensor protein